jgi:hypothetical protein
MELHSAESQPASVISREALLDSHKLKIIQSQVALALEESAIDICLQVTALTLIFSAKNDI